MRLFVPMTGLTILVMLAIAVSGRPGWPLLIGAAVIWLAGMALVLRPLLRQPKLDISLPAPSAEDAAATDVVADRARDILNALPDPLLLIGEGREITWANQAAERQFGGRLAGRNLLAVLRHPPLLDAIEAIRLGLEPEEGEESGLDAPLRLDIGHETEYQAVVVPLHAQVGPGGSGRTALAARDDGDLLILLRDVTAARRLDNLRSDFIANVSHELKTPLATLLGFIETMRGPAKDDPKAQERFLGIMHDQASRMTRMVSDLLSLSRIELHEHSRPRGTTDLARVLGSVADGLSWKAQNRKIKLCLPDPDLLPCVPGDSDELTQVFQNLIDNAIKYSREGSKVTVEASVITDPVQLKSRLTGLRDPKGMVAITVKDQGEGIARQHLPRLTERFYRVDAARSRDMGGTGLGLAIVKHIVSHHRGSLDIDSVLGEGSIFTVYLPLPE
ncbi:MAG TPA: ATP-binding protein [Dongiaceae bacterium]|nr:ATP-binding protein [Dongiaceae bacterium]